MSDVILNMLPLKTQEERDWFQSAAPEATHIYTRRTTVTPEELERATVIFGWPRARDMKYAVNLKWFQCMFAGVDEYLPHGTVVEGAAITTSSGSNALSVAENMLATMLALFRKLPTYRDHQREHIWKDEGTAKTITGATVLVVGAGNLGQHFAQRCKALGAARTVGLKRSLGDVPGFDEIYSLDQLDELLPQADVVALTLPHSPQTVHLMNADRIGGMKDDAVLISSGRGTVLDQEALVEAMNNGKLWGAALDVTEPEPLPANSPLWDVPNLLLTPHVAGGMRLDITRKNCLTMARDNLVRYVAGEPLKNLVKR